MFLRTKPDTKFRILSLCLLLTLVVSWLASPQPGLAAVFQTLPKIGLITDGGQIDDNNFNQMAYAGLHRAFVEGLVEENVYIPACVEGNCDYSGSLTQCVLDGNALCITVGFMMSNATMVAATTYPEVNFAIADMSWGEGEYPANLRGTYFAVHEASYLAGTMAGLMSETKKIGVVGGMSIPPVNDFILPYSNGAQWADHDVVVIVDYANDFESEVIGAGYANEQIAQGADVIYGVGGTMGNGAIKRAAEQGKWAVGVDVDTFFTAFNGGDGSVPGAEFLLTSVLKKLDNAVYQTILDQRNGTFTSGTAVYNVANDGVGLAPFHQADASIPNNVRQAVNNVAQGIADGSIDVWAPYWRYIFLPVLVR